MVDVDTNQPVYIPVEITLKSPPSTNNVQSQPETSLDKERNECRTAVSESPSCIKFQCVAPCLLPELHSIQEIRTCTPRYWPRLISTTNYLRTSTCTQPQTQSQVHILTQVLPEHMDDRDIELDFKSMPVIYVKRKAGFLSYATDPNGLLVFPTS